MAEVLTKNTEQIFAPSPVVQEYSDIADRQYKILHELEQALIQTPNPEDATVESVNEFARFLAEEESEKWRAEGGSERFEQLLEGGPRQAERLIEMAWEARQSSAVDMYQVSDGAVNGRRKSRQIINAENLAQELDDISSKFNLTEAETRTLNELAQLEASELDELWHGFERVAHKGGRLDVVREHAAAKLNEKAEADELEQKRQERHAEAQVDALSTANIIRYEAKKIMLATDPKGYKRGSYSAFKETYTESNEDSAWATESLSELYEKHTDHDSPAFKQKLARLAEKLLSQAVGQAVFEHVQSGTASDRNEYFANKIKSIAGIERAKDPDLTLSEHELRELGASLLASYRKRQAQIDATRAKQQVWLERGSRGLDKVDARLEKVADKIIDLATGTKAS